jgi:hypothetical protein
LRAALVWGEPRHISRCSMRGPHTLSYIEASAGCRSEGDKHSKDLRLLLDRWGRQIMLQHRQLSRQATEAKDSRCARRARLGCVHRCVRKRRRSIHAFYVRSRRRDVEAQTGSRTVVGEMKTKKPLRRRARRSRRPSTTPGAIVWACSTVALPHSTALIYPFHRRANAPRAINNNECLPYRQYSSRMVQMKGPSILRIEMLRSKNTQWKPTPACHLRTRQLIK